jgi:uncharacterized protein (TIGR02284 family)
MHTDSEHAVKVLNSLIETTLDSANGYREAAENAREGELKTLFAERAQRRMEITRELQQEVRTFGGEPEDDQSVLGKAHNKFVDLKNAVMGGRDDTAVIDEVERGEDFIKDKFDTAMRDDELPMEAREVVTRLAQTIRADHDRISEMKHARH